MGLGGGRGTKNLSSLDYEEPAGSRSLVRRVVGPKGRWSEGLMVQRVVGPKALGLTLHYTNLFL